METEPRDILVLGFSVTAEAHSYVEVAQKRPGVSNLYRLSKVAIGGVTLVGLRFLLPHIMMNRQPDLVVIEIATSGIRNWEFDVKYQRYLEDLIGYFQEQKIAISFLDLPREGVDPKQDWQVGVHETYAKKIKAPYRFVPMKDADLRDYVHASLEGHEIYATILLEFLEDAFKFALSEQANVVTLFPYLLESPPFSELISANLDRQSFHRSGMKTEVVLLPETMSLQVSIPSGMKVAGFSYLMGPQTGMLEVTAGTFKKNLLAYDEFSYYERMSFWTCEPMGVSSLIIEQSPDSPDVVLRKGEPNDEPRIGKLGHLFLEKNTAQTDVE